MARMTLSDFISELNARGFDGFSSTELVRYVNFGYRDIGRLTKWSWEETDWSLSLDPGGYAFVRATSTPTLKSIVRVVITTLTREARLKAMEEQKFYDDYAAYDLTLSQNRGEPEFYYFDNDNIYILPPPLETRAINIRGEQYLAELVSGSNETPITPAEYDQAILVASEMYCHIRARQKHFADESRQQLREFFDDALADEHTQMQDQQPRIKAGRTTL